MSRSKIDVQVKWRSWVLGLYFPPLHMLRGIPLAAISLFIGPLYLTLTIQSRVGTDANQAEIVQAIRGAG